MIARLGKSNRGHLVAGDDVNLWVYRKRVSIAYAKGVMGPGDMLFLYTGGVTAAINAELEIFGNDRTIRSLNDLKGKPVRKVIYGMREAIDGFMADAQVSDDATMLAVTLAAL